MIKWGMLGLAGALWFSAGAAWADGLIEPTEPPREKILKGMLSWENIKQRNGSMVKGRLFLTVGDRQIALPVTSGSKVKATQDGEGIAVEKFLGKQVTLTAMVSETANRKGTYTLVKSVTRIEEDKQVETAVHGK